MKNRTRQDRQPRSERKDSGLVLRVLPEDFGICRLGPKSRTPRWVHDSSFYSISRSSDELSIVCEERLIPERLRCERGWRAIQVVGTLDMSLIGVLESLARPLTRARVSLFTVSTFDTDYLLVRSKNLETAIEALESAGHQFGDELLRADEETAVEDGIEPPTERSEQTREAEPPPSESEQSGEAEPGSRQDDLAQEGQDREKEQRPGKPRRRRRPRRRQKRPEAEPAESLNAEAVPSEPPEPVEPKPASEPPRSERPDPEKEITELETNLEADRSEDRDEASERKRGPRNRVVRVLTDLFASVRNEAARVSPDATGAAGAVDADDETLKSLEGEAENASQPPEPEDATPEETSARQTAKAAQSEEPPKPKKRRRRRKKPATERRREDVSDIEPRKAARAEPEPERAEVPDDGRTDAPRREQRSSQDEGDDVTGLYTGAIPQEPPVALTEGNFEPLGLSEPILRTIAQVGFTHPTPIQAGVIPHALEGHDIIGLAETGSGKTAAFSLPLAERLTHGRGIRGLILCPTREIALQTKAFLDLFGKDHELETVAVIGGVKMGPQISGFRRQADILVATPGRLADHLRRRNLELDQLEELVLDEADHMLDLGFLPQIREILEQVPGGHRTMMFSATMPPPIENLTKLFMNDPVRVDVRPEGQVASGIEHRLYLVKEDDMKDCVVALLREVEGSTLIFTRRKLYTEWLARQLDLAGFAAARIHSDRSQAQRVRALRGFREGKHRILVATDVAARGLDIPRIEHVINYSLPETTEDYVHRAGRTARGQAAGVVSSIGTWQDKITIRDLESRLGIKIPRCTVEGIEPWVELKKRKTVRRRRML